MCRMSTLNLLTYCALYLKALAGNVVLPASTDKRKTETHSQNTAPYFWLQKEHHAIIRLQ